MRTSGRNWTLFKGKINYRASAVLDFVISAALSHMASTYGLNSSAYSGSFGLQSPVPSSTLAYESSKTLSQQIMATEGCFLAIRTEADPTRHSPICHSFCMLGPINFKRTGITICLIWKGGV